MAQNYARRLFKEFVRVKIYSFIQQILALFVFSPILLHLERINARCTANLQISNIDTQTRTDTGSDGYEIDTAIG